MKYGKQVRLCGFILCAFLLCGIIIFGFGFFLEYFIVIMGANSMRLHLRNQTEHEIEEIHIENATYGTIFSLNLTHTNLSQYPTFQEALIEFYNMIQNPLTNKTTLWKQIPKDEYNRVRSELLFLQEYRKESGRIINVYYFCLTYYECYIDYDWYDNAPM